MMDSDTLSNGQSHDFNGFNTNTCDQVGEQLKTIRQLVQKLKAKDEQRCKNQSIHQLYNIWSKLSSLCEQSYLSSANYYKNLGKKGDDNYQIVSITNEDSINRNANKISQYNGIKSLIKIISKFVFHVEYAVAQVNGDTINYEVLKDVSDLLLNLTEIVNNSFIGTTAVVSGKYATIYLLQTYIQSRDKLTKGIKGYWSKYPAFWLDKDCQWISSLFSLASSSLSSLPCSLISLVSSTAHGRFQEDLLHSANPYFPLNLTNYVNNPAISSLNWLSCKYHGLSVKEIKVYRQTKWHIPFDEETGDDKIKYIPDGVDTLTASERKLNPIKCRLIQQAGINPNGNVIFHAQGGALTIELSPVYDQCFREWTPHLEGAAILDVTYSRFVRYPVQLQELLDVFLWLTNYETTKSVSSALGFIPKKIIFCGDSAGGLFLFALATITRDIQLIFSSSTGEVDKPFPDHLYPRSFITFYPVLSATIPTVQPSLILSFMDQFLTPLTILNCLSLYSAGIIFDSDCVNPESSDSSRYTKPDRWQAFYNTWVGKRKNWLQCDSDTLASRVDQISEKALTTYQSPLISYDLNLIKDLNVYLIVGEFDPFLDTNIEFAQLWPGKITLDVCDELGHGFLALTWTSSRAREAASLCLKRILEAFSD